MRFYPTRIHVVYLCYFFLAFFVLISCSKDSDLLLAAVLIDDPTAIDEPREVPVTGVENPEPEEDGLESRTTSFSPTHDAYLQQGKGYNQSIIRLEEGNRTSYLMFDLRAIEAIGGEITQATLQFTINSDSGSGNITVRKGTSNDWSEDALTASTVPAPGIALGSLTKEYLLDATEIIPLSAKDLSPGLATLILEHQDGNDLAFASKEHPLGIGPKLVVTYTAPVDAEEIVPLVPEVTTPAPTPNLPGPSPAPGANAEPVAVADGTPTTGKVPFEVTFSGSNSTDDVKIATYAWDFKDGSTATVANPKHTFTEKGSYEVVLTVTDEAGLSSTDTVTITATDIENQAPVAILSATPITGAAPLLVTFKGSDSTDDTAVTSYAWDFKDGSSATSANPQHTFDTPGTYNVDLTVRDENGLSNKKSISITVTAPVNQPPKAVGTSNVTSGPAPLVVQFNGSQSSDDKGITAYAWNFKDGTTSTAISPTHTFQNPGSYQVTLTVTDANGATHTDTDTITVTAPGTTTPATPTTPTAPNPALPGYYVTTAGSANNDGKSEASAWSLEHAFFAVKAGDIVYVKAGNYGNKTLVTRNGGSTGLPIKFIGYAKVPGDVVSSNGSTFSMGASLDSTKMPMLSAPNLNRTAIEIQDGFIEIENFQINGYGKAIHSGSLATNVVMRNIITTNTGNQGNSSGYDGFALTAQGNNTIIENCFVKNPTAQGITLSNSDNSIVRYSTVYADNTTNPTDYFFILGNGTSNSKVENSIAERAGYLSHGGHGFNAKDATYNVFTNCIAKRTSFEFTYSGAHHNTVNGGAIYGYGTGPANWAARLAIIGGAHHNTIRNLDIFDTYVAISWTTFNNETGLEANIGNDNIYENISVKNTNRILGVGGGTNYNAKAMRNKFLNCDFSDFDSVAVTYYESVDIEFKNCVFKNGNKFVVEVDGVYAPYSNFDATWINCTWQNVKFTPPN